MTKKLSLDDFRAVRTILEPHEWAVGGNGIVPPSDQIDPETWHGIIDLPDDIAISVSDHNGPRLKLLYGLWSDWIHAIGTPGREDELYNCMLDAADCFQCATFLFLHGYYRSALADLRSALELVLFGAFGNLQPNDKSYLHWKNSAWDLPFTSTRRRLFAALENAPAGRRLLQDDGLLAITYRELCSFAHTRPNASDGALWQSNGPVYNNAAIKLVFDKSLLVYALSYLLVKIARPEFVLSDDSRIVFELDWLQNHSDLLKAYGELNGPR